MTINEDIVAELHRLKDEKFQAFQANLIPTIDSTTIIGVRTPALRSLARTLVKNQECEIFLNTLPHHFFEENQLHVFVISLDTDFERCLKHIEVFLPHIDNWATCDQCNPKAFKKNPESLLPYLEQWLSTDHTYTIRFGISMFMRHFLDEKFEPSHLERIACISTDEYYVKMMIAWYYATALAKQYDHTLPFMEALRSQSNHCLDPWTFNKAIQKALESNRIAPDQKDHLRTLKIR